MFWRMVRPFVGATHVTGMPRAARFAAHSGRRDARMQSREMATQKVTLGRFTGAWHPTIDKRLAVSVLTLASSKTPLVSEKRTGKQEHFFYVRRSKSVYVSR